MALSAASGEAYSTRPYPRERPYRERSEREGGQRSARPGLRINPQGAHARGRTKPGWGGRPCETAAVVGEGDPRRRRAGENPQFQVEENGVLRRRNGPRTPSSTGIDPWGMRAAGDTAASGDRPVRLAGEGSACPATPAKDHAYVSVLRNVSAQRIGRGKQLRELLARHRPRQVANKHFHGHSQGEKRSLTSGL